jgi:hypothetical protein
LLEVWTVLGKVRRYRGWAVTPIKIVPPLADFFVATFPPSLYDLFIAGGERSLLRVRHVEKFRGEVGEEVESGSFDRQI